MLINTFLFQISQSYAANHMDEYRPKARIRYTNKLLCIALIVSYRFLKTTIYSLPEEHSIAPCLLTKDI